jgi:hypothetical protein
MNHLQAATVLPRYIQKTLARRRTNFKSKRLRTAAYQRLEIVSYLGAINVTISTTFSSDTLQAISIT